MRTIGWQVKLLLVILCFAAHSNGQQSTKKVLYHWVTRDKVYCWRSLTDPTPVLATRVSGGWAISPDNARTAPAWLDVLKASVPAETPSSRTWNVFLNKLQNDQLNDDAVGTRTPDAQVYLRYHAPNVVIVTFVKAQKDETVTFVKEAQEWKPSNKNHLDKLSITGAEMKAIFGVQQAPSSVQAAWGKWITRFLESQSNINPVMSQEATANPEWIWQERLLESDWHRRLALPRTADPQQPQGPATEDGGINQPPNGQEVEQLPFYKEWWFLISLPVVLMFIFLFILWRFPRTLDLVVNTWGALWSLTKSRGQEKTSRGKNHKRTSSRKPGSASESSQFEDLCSEYAEAANQGVSKFLEKVRAQVEAQNAQVLQEYGLTDLDSASVKELIDLGREVENCHAALIKVQRVGVNSSGATLYPGQRTKTEWLAALKQSIPSAVTKIKEQADSIQELPNITAERNSLKQQLADTKKSLETSQKESVDARSAVNENSVRFSTELEQERNKYASLQKRVDVINGSVTSCAGYMHQGLRYYRDETQDIPSAMAISALTNHSLYKLCIGISSQDDMLRDAMLVNLYSIASKCSHLNGFKLAVPEMRKQFPGIEDYQNHLTRSNKTHFNDTLFQRFLGHLRSSSQLELAPFYFDVDKDKKVHYAS